MRRFQVLHRAASTTAAAPTTVAPPVTAQTLAARAAHAQQFKVELAAASAQPAPTFESILADWTEYPSVVQQLHQLNNAIADFGRDQLWVDMQKQFRHNTNDQTIDWDYAAQHLPADMIKYYKDTLRDAKIPEMDFNRASPKIAAVTEEFAAEVFELQEQHDALVPLIERDLKRNNYILDNLDTLTADDMRPLDPETFKQIDKEVDELNWDASSATEATHKDAHHAAAKH